MPDVTGVEEERRQGTPEISIRFDRERLARLGLTVGDAAEASRPGSGALPPRSSPSGTVI
jgi:Cu/Ag efflux pump CusA